MNQWVKNSFNHRWRRMKARGTLWLLLIGTRWQLQKVAWARRRAWRCTRMSWTVLQHEEEPINMARRCGHRMNWTKGISWWTLRKWHRETEESREQSRQGIMLSIRKWLKRRIRKWQVVLPPRAPPNLELTQANSIILKIIGKVSFQKMLLLTAMTPVSRRQKTDQMPLILAESQLLTGMRYQT